MTVKRILVAALAACLVLSCLLMGGCSTPKVAAEVDGKVYETADFLAYMYNTLVNDQTAYMYLYYYGKDGLDQEVPYGEGDNAENIPLRDYIVRATKDTLVRQKVLEDKLAEYGVEWDADDRKTVEEGLSSLTADQFIEYGFNNARYEKAYKAYALNESSLFYGLYGKGGKREVAEADKRAYFDENYLSYEIIEISLVDDEGKELDETKTAEAEKRLQGYLDTFNKSGKTAVDFDTVYKAEQQYLAAQKTDADTDTEDEKEEETAERNDVIAEKMTDEDLRKAILEIDEGSAAIKTYQKDGTNKTIALIFRMDPEAERGENVDYYADESKNILQYMKYEEFDKEIDDAVAALGDKVKFYDKAINACDPAEMIPEK